MNNQQIEQLNRLLNLELTAQLRYTIYYRVYAAMRNRSLQNFRSATLTSAPIIYPLSLYDLLRRLPEAADFPINQFGEVVSYLCQMLENFRIQTKLRSQTTIQASDDMQNFILQLTAEAASQCLNQQLILVYDQLKQIALRVFQAPCGLLQSATQTYAPTQSDIEALKEYFQQIKSHHGKAAVIGRFLRECGVQAGELVANGGVYDIDFTALPNQMFWRLARICKRYAPKIKLIE